MSDEPRRVLIYWDSAGLRIKSFLGRDARGVAQLKTFELREGEFGPGVEFIEAAPILAERQRNKDYADQCGREAAVLETALRRITLLTAPAHTPDPLKVMHEMDDIAREALEQAGRTQPKQT